MKIVVPAGPTREYLDPVRFLSNPSTGKMGFAIAAEAAKRGHEVVLVAGPATLIDAQKHPEKYLNLRVRVSGFSGYFVRFKKTIQDEIIARTVVQP